MVDNRDGFNVGALVTTLTAVAAPTAAAHLAVPPDGVTFSQAGFTVIAFLIGALAAVISLLFKLLLTSKDVQLQDKDEQIKELTRLAYRGTDTADRAIEHAERVRTRRGE